MSEIEILTGGGRSRRWTAAEKLRIVDAQTALGLIKGRIEHYNDNHPHSGLKMRSPREFIAAQTATA